MRILVIGATGFIGAYVVRLLVQQGHDLAILHRGQTTANFAGHVLHIYGDRNALADIQPRLEEFGPEVVLDIIGYTERHAQGLVDVCRGVAQRVVVLSSADVYRSYDGFRGNATAPPESVPLSEDAPLRETRYPYRGYGLAFDWADDYDKILVERTVLGVPDLPGTVLRLPAVYGPGDQQHRVGAYLRRMDDGRPAILLAQGQGEWRWTRGYVENVAAAVALAVTDDRSVGRIYNVGEELALTEREWIEMIGAAAGWTGTVVTIPAEQMPKHLRQPYDFRYHIATCTDRIRAELGYDEPIQRGEALRRTIKWERSQFVESDEQDYAAEDTALSARNDAT